MPRLTFTRVGHVHEFADQRAPLTTDEASAVLAGGCGCPTEALAIATETAREGDDTPITWEGVIGVEGELTGDGRFIETNALDWDNLPIPLRHSPIDNGGHDGAIVVGRIATIERQADGTLFARGDFDLSEAGREAARLVGENLSRGVSMDLDSVAFEIRVAREVYDGWTEDPTGEAPEPETASDGSVILFKGSPDDEVMAITSARVRAATLVSIPAFASAQIDLTGSAPADVEEDTLTASAGSLVAGGFPVQPPADWFSAPRLDGPTPLVVTDDGRVFGHLATWDVCHTGYPGQCVTAPSSPTDYAYFRTGSVVTADGASVATGAITLDTTHAAADLDAKSTMSHYDHTGRAVADVAAGEDSFGIWVSGSLRPGVTPEQVRELRASPLSGDWRRIGQGLELVAALAVNVPGFPIPRPRGLVASGQMHSLVASGMVAPMATTTEGLSAEDLATLRALAARARAQEEASKVTRTSEAPEAVKALAARLTADALAAKVYAATSKTKEA